MASVITGTIEQRTPGHIVESIFGHGVDGGGVFPFIQLGSEVLCWKGADIVLHGGKELCFVLWLDFVLPVFNCD